MFLQLLLDDTWVSMFKDYSNMGVVLGQRSLGHFDFQPWRSDL